LFVLVQEPQDVPVTLPDAVSATEQQQPQQQLSENIVLSVTDPEP
jgi:hypothetical protein